MRKTTVGVLLGAAMLLSAWAVIAYGLMVDRVRSAFADEDGFSLIAIEFSPDAPQRDLYLALVLILGILAVQSRHWTYRALVLGAIAYFGLEAYYWAGVGSVAFDYVSTASHVAAGAGLALGFTGYRLNASTAVITSIAPALVIVEYTIWAVDTAALRRSAGVDVLQPPTILNNVLYGAQWFHVLTVLLACIAFALLLVRSNAHEHPKARSN